MRITVGEDGTIIGSGGNMHAPTTVRVEDASGNVIETVPFDYTARRKIQRGRW